MTCPTEKVRSWKTDAARTASAPPSRTAGAKCASAPAPPEATIGTDVAARATFSIARSKPASVPSASMEVRRISPAPRAVTSATQVARSIPVIRRPPCVETTNRCPVPLRVDGDDDALRTEPLRQPRDERRVGDGGGVHGDAVGPGGQERAGVLDGADAAPDGERDREDVCDGRDEAGERAALLVRGGHVEEAELVRPFGLVAARGLDRVARVAQVLELQALDDAAPGDVEARDDADGEAHDATSRSAARAAASRATVVAPE